MYGGYSYASTEYGGTNKPSALQRALTRIYKNLPDVFKWKRGMFMSKLTKFKKKLF